MTERPAEAIFANGKILTGAGLRADGRANRSGASPAMVSHLAVRDGRVLAVGGEAEVGRWRGSETQWIDLGGAFAMPGFNDAHVHLGLAGQHGLALDLRGSASLGEMLGRVEQYGRGGREGEWLLGGGWDETQWEGTALPTRAELDAVTGERPAMLWRVDAHVAVANSAALRRADIDALSGDPAGARIDRDGSGRATGVLRETAATSLVSAVVPPLTGEQRRQGLRLAMLEAAAHGLTSVQDNSDWEDFPVLLAMHRAGELPVRVAEWMDFTRPVGELEERRRSQQADDPWLHLTQLKGFLDGSLGSRTAALLAPYADDPATRGLLRYDQESLLAMTQERMRRGFSIAFHAIGDEANRMALDVLALALSESGVKGHGLRCRVEHAQVVAASDRARFGRLGVLASMQPVHLLGDLPWVGARLGSERTADAYAWRSILRGGATLAFGTDYPVESVDPLRGLYSAVSRQGERGGAVFEGQERLTVEEAIFAYTQGAAFAEFREGTKGRLESGYLADMVVLSGNPLRCEPAELLAMTVERTVIGGMTVFEAARDRGAEAGRQ